MLSEEKIIDQIMFLEYGQVQIRETTKIFKDGIEIAKTYHRRIITPDDDVTNEDPRVKVLAETDWTPERKEKYRLGQEKNKIK